MNELTDIFDEVIRLAVGSPIVAILVQMVKNTFKVSGKAIRWVAILIGIVVSVLLVSSAEIPVGTELWYHWVTYIGAGIIVGLTSTKVWDLAKKATERVNER
ncbi:MAG: hypothetical protein KAH30_07260 [Caldisericia bacterium]|nr:hypothetical protein [Caldisericia bacterium]